MLLLLVMVLIVMTAATACWPTTPVNGCSCYVFSTCTIDRANTDSTVVVVVCNGTALANGWLLWTAKPKQIKYSGQRQRPRPSPNFDGYDRYWPLHRAKASTELQTQNGCSLLFRDGATWHSRIVRVCKVRGNWTDDVCVGRWSWSYSACVRACVYSYLSCYGPPRYDVVSMLWLLQWSVCQGACGLIMRVSVVVRWWGSHKTISERESRSESASKMSAAAVPAPRPA